MSEITQLQVAVCDHLFINQNELGIIQLGEGMAIILTCLC